MVPWRALTLVVLALVVLALAASGQSGNDFTFAILGDRTGDAVAGVYEAVWRDVAALHPDFVVNVGDTIQGGNDRTAESEWQAIRPIWERYGRPFYLVPGNHDIWSGASRKIFEQQTGHPAPYGFNFQNAHFTVLDNSDDQNLSAEQMEFLDRDLAANKDRNPKFVLFHQPFWLIPVRFHSSDFPFHKVMKKYGVGFVLSGHVHQFVRLTQDGVVYMEAGSSGGKLKGQGFEKGWFYGQTFARVKGSNVEMTVRELGPPFGEGRKFNAADWGENGLTAPARR